MPLDAAQQLPSSLTFGQRCAYRLALASNQACASIIDQELAAYLLTYAPPVAVKGQTKAGTNIPPTPEEVTAYSASIGYPLDGASFCDSYEAKGWQVGKVKMKNWQAAVRNWKQNRWGKLIAGNTHHTASTDAKDYSKF